MADKKIGSKFKKIKISQEKVLFSTGIFLFVVLIGSVVFTIITLNNNIIPVFSSNGIGDVNGIHFDFDGYKALGL